MTPEQKPTPPLPFQSPPANVPSPEPDSANPEAPADPNKLTADEQMARFEQELKETDWGHQPC